MYGKVKSLFVKMSDTVKNFFLAVMLGVCALVAPAMAQTTNQTITIEQPNIDWSSIPTQIMSTLTTPVIVGIGIALSICVIFMSINFFRRSARG
jgi:hypothetical protein